VGTGIDGDAEAIALAGNNGNVLACTGCQLVNVFENSAAANCNIADIGLTNCKLGEIIF
jgi:hypothetical protein